ncbi:MAG: MBL fold metallo-hydrolase [Balneola sp.]|nr:MBL fold metallo-hydrolase [Balneola sp.]|tara:strand:+ start:6165 stop:7124 length:960 start_codon:yes stop_codon:yes gene_type:complete
MDTSRPIDLSLPSAGAIQDHRWVRFGSFELHWIETGDIWLDGGAMFGIVPKTLWARQLPPDDKNRIPMTMRCLLIRSLTTGRLYLVDNGAGNKFNEKMTSIYGLSYGAKGEKQLESSLARAGVQPSEITDLIFTHLHFDHCGGTTDYVDGTLTHVFPNACYHVHPDHFRTATKPNPREQASFLPDNIGPIASACERLYLLNVSRDNVNHPVYEPGLDALVMNGHTLGQQLPKITSGDQHLVFVADLFPTAQHLPLVWIMGYDMFPTQTLKEKHTILEQATAEQWWLLMEHDRFHECIQVGNIDGRWKVIATSTLNDLVF